MSHAWGSDVEIVPRGEGRELLLVGTAHVSQESVDLVREVIEKEEPDCVCVELDSQRFEALSQKQRWDRLDLREVIRKRQLSTLVANLLLAAYQRKLGRELGVVPGTELLEAARVAQERGIPIALCDRDVRVTLRRAWLAVPWWKKAWLLSTLLVSVFERPKLTEDDLRELRSKDVLNELMGEMASALPELKRALIDERDAYLAERLRQAEGARVVAVVGAGHVAGIRRALEEDAPVDMAALESVPSVSPVWKWIGWGIPAAVVAGLLWIGWSQGAAAAGENAAYWFLANAIPSGLGALAALGHPATVLAAALAAPFTSLTPVIGAGYVSAFVQTWLRPPVVSEFERLGEDAGRAGAWWSNRLLRILLVFLLTTVGSLIGTWVGGLEIARNVF